MEWGEAVAFQVVDHSYSNADLNPHWIAGIAAAAAAAGVLCFYARGE